MKVNDYKDPPYDREKYFFFFFRRDRLEECGFQVAFGDNVIWSSQTSDFSLKTFRTQSISTTQMLKFSGRREPQRASESQIKRH